MNDQRTNSSCRTSSSKIRYQLSTSSNFRNGSIASVSNRWALRPRQVLPSWLRELPRQSMVSSSPIPEPSAFLGFALPSVALLRSAMP